MVYCSTILVGWLKEHLSDHEPCIIVNNHNPNGSLMDASCIGDLDSLMRSSGKGFPILLISEAYLMRGINYRSAVGVD